MNVDSDIDPIISQERHVAAGMSRRRAVGLTLATLTAIPLGVACRNSSESKPAAVTKQTAAAVAKDNPKLTNPNNWVTTATNTQVPLQEALNMLEKPFKHVTAPIRSQIDSLVRGLSGRRDQNVWPAYLQMATVGPISNTSFDSHGSRESIKDMPIGEGRILVARRMFPNDLVKVNQDPKGDVYVEHWLEATPPVTFMEFNVGFMDGYSFAAVPVVRGGDERMSFGGSVEDVIAATAKIITPTAPRTLVDVVRRESSFVIQGVVEGSDSLNYKVDSTGHVILRIK